MMQVLFRCIHRRTQIPPSQLPTRILYSINASCRNQREATQKPVNTKGTRHRFSDYENKTNEFSTVCENGILKMDKSVVVDVSKKKGRRVTESTLETGISFIVVNVVDCFFKTESAIVTSSN